jgi:hypothetical protein
MVKKTLHIVYSTIGWQPNQSWQKYFATVSEEKKEEEYKRQRFTPNCCDMTLPYFRELLVAEARRQGFKVVRWPFRGKDAWLAIGEAARNGQMTPGAAAVLCHSWAETRYCRECVPAWDFYPVLDAVMAQHDLVYPHEQLDQLHSEKRYTSTLMPPTRFIHLVRRPEGWRVRGRGKKDVSLVVKEELKKLKSKVSAKGMLFDDIMVKQGLSWAGNAVTRLAPSSVQDFMKRKMLPNLPEAAQSITVLLQAKLEIVSELRWCMVDGELRGREWKSLNKPKRGQRASQAGYQDQHEARKLVEKFVEKSPTMANITMKELEKRMGVLCKKVYAEAVSDAGGERPLYLRVDLLLDKQGRVWLGERESWGADLNGNDEYKKMDPTLKELAIKMIGQCKDRLHKSLKRKLRTIAIPRSKSARGRVIARSSGTASSKRRRIRHA